MDPTKRISLNVFARILRDQLRVNKEQFWEAIDTGRPVSRPMELDEPPHEYSAWVIKGLLKYGYTEDRIREMTPAEAEALLQEKWSSSDA